MPNPNIPLSVQQVDPVSPLLMLQQGRRQQAQDAERAKLNQLTIEDLNRRGELNELQMKGQRTQNAAGELGLDREYQRQIAEQLETLDIVARQGNPQATAMVGQQLRKTLQMSGQDTSDVDATLSKIGSDFPAAQREIAENAAALRATHKQLFADVKGPDGSVVAQRNTQSGQLTSVPDSMLQNSEYKNVTRLDNGAFVGLKNGVITQIPQDDTAIGAYAAAQQIKQTEDEIKAAGENFDKAGKIRSEIARATGDFQKIKGAYDRITASAENPSAAGDLALIFNYMKMLDPGSTVREGEFATAQNSGGVDDRIIASYNKLLNGERLAPEQRSDFLAQSRSIFNRVKSTNDSVVNGYVDLAKGFGLTRDQVVVQGLDSFSTPEDLFSAADAIINAR